VALLLAFHAEAVAALDVSAAMLDICRERAHDQGLANVGPIQGDSLNLPFPAGAFDLVASQLMLHHSADPTHALAEMARVCIAGGTLIISDMISPPDPAAAQLLNRFELIRDPSHTRALARSELTKMLEERGFQIEELQEARARLELEDWLHRGGADPAARVHLREEFARLPDSLRRTFNVELIDGVTHFNWPMLVLRTVMS
jgi:ubiquinone/menaquinone biosynthesis C-methylase UbiE